MVDYYSTRSIEELLVLLRAAEDRLNGGAIVAVSQAGSSVSKQHDARSSVERDIVRLRYSLYLRDSTTYADPYAEQVRTTRPYYLE